MQGLPVKRAAKNTPSAAPTANRSRKRVRSPVAIDRVGNHATAIVA
jgi:hypothetical protein